MTRCRAKSASRPNNILSLRAHGGPHVLRGRIFADRIAPRAGPDPDPDGLERRPVDHLGPASANWPPAPGNLQKIYLALGFYRNDNGAYPFLPEAQTSAEPLSLLIPKGTTDTAIFICPGSGDKPLPESEPFGKLRISYDYYMGRATNGDPKDILLSDWQVDTSPKKKGRQIFSLDGKKPGNNHGTWAGIF
jgi:hypothetical protein